MVLVRTSHRHQLHSLTWQHDHPKEEKDDDVIPAHLLKLFTICGVHILIYDDESPLLLCSWLSCQSSWERVW